MDNAHKEFMKIYYSLLNEGKNRRPVSINEVLENIIHLKEEEKQKTIQWWNKNASDVNIYVFPFKIPVIGVCVGSDSVCLNEHSFLDSISILFILLHEAGHCKDSQNEEPYFKTVKENNKEEFIIVYKRAESKANDYAIKAFNEIGIPIPPGMRNNENFGDSIFNMMRRDILKTGANSLFELAKIQIGF